MKEGDKGRLDPFPYPIEKAHGGEETTSAKKRWEMTVPQGAVIASPIDGRLLIGKGDKDPGEDSNTARGIKILFTGEDGKKYELSISGIAGVDIASGLPTLLSVQKEESDTGVEVKRGAPLFEISGHNQRVVLETKPQQS